MPAENNHFTQDDFKIIERESIYQGHFTLSLLHLKHKLYRGGWSSTIKREYLERSQAAALLPYDPILDRIILVEQFRIGALADPINPWQIEIPAGLIDTHQTPEQVAIRETQEEAGCDVRNVQCLYDYFVSPGISNEYIHIFYGEVDASHIEGVHGLAEENEDIKALNLSASQALGLLHDGQIKNGPTIIALQWFELNHSRLRQN